MKKTINNQMAVAEKRYGKTTKGTAQKAKPKTTVRPTGSIKKPGIKVTVKW